MTATTEVESTAAGRVRAPTIVVSLLFVVAATVAQLLRQSGIEMWRTVWAEDGVQFYADALDRPLREILVEPYAGYAHVIPRTLASIGVHLPVEWYSYYAAITAAVIASLLALFVYFASAPLLRSQSRQGVLALALLLWPVLPFEITGNITNIQWLVPVACLLAVLFPVDRPAAIAVRLVVVGLGPLSSPVCVMLAPIAVWHVGRGVLRKASVRRTVVPAVYLGATAVQLAVWATAPQTDPTRPPVGDFLVDFGRLYSTRVTTEMLFGVRATESLWSALGHVLAVGSLVLVGGFLLWKLVRASTASRAFIVVAVGASVAIYAFSIWQRPEFLESMLIGGQEDFNFLAMRYELFPAALLLLALLVPVDLERTFVTEPRGGIAAPLAADVRRQWPLLVVAAVWFAVAFVPSFRLTTARSPGPDWVASVERAQQACLVQPGSSQIVTVPPDPIWRLELSCARLGGP